MAVHLNIEPVSPRKYNRNIPVALEHIILRAMAKEAEKRYKSVSEMLQELHTVAATFFDDGGRLPGG